MTQITYKYINSVFQTMFFLKSAIVSIDIYGIIGIDIHQVLVMLQCESQKSPRGLVAIFPKRLGTFKPNFTCLLRVPIYARPRIFVQLSPTLTKICYIKCDYPAYISVDGGHFEHIMVVALNMA